jgi:hypothetical protein
MTTDILQIADEDFWEKVYERHQAKGGVYKIIAVNNYHRVPIKRFLGIDDEGILYIGKAISYLDRVINLKKSISPDYKGSGHICGRRYKSNSKIAEQFPYNYLHIELIQTDNPKQEEAKYLKEYFNKFGEAPPLNVVY